MRKLIEEYLDEVKQIADSINIKDIAKVIVILYEAWLNNKTIYLCGNGGSASTASHFTCDLLKLGIKAHCLNDNSSRITAITNDSGFDALYVEQLNNLLSGGDVLVCISVHGGVERDRNIWSGNLVKAVDFARRKKAKIIGLVGFEGGVIRRLADASIKINSYSTPQVESWHSHIAHLICLILAEYKPVKVCDECHRIYTLDKLECPSCQSVKFSLARGIIGNIEDIRKGAE